MSIFAYTTLDDPAAVNGTFATGINAAGQVVGDYNDAGNSAHGFIYAGGGYANFSDPDAGNSGDTLADGINNLGQIVGHYVNFPQELGYIKIGNNYRSIVNPTNVNNVTEAHGINSIGEVVGEYTDAAGTHGFVYLRDLGVFATFYDPAFPTVILNGINENGTLIVGLEGGAGVPHGFLFNGVFEVPLQDPFAGNLGTSAQGVNDSGQVVGYYYDAGNHPHGFLYSGGTRGTYTTIDVGARGTFINGINDAGQMVGTYQDSSGHFHGFVGSFQPNPAPGGRHDGGPDLARSQQLGGDRRPIRDLRHRQQCDPRGLLARPGRHRFPVCRPRPLLRRRHRRHDAAQRLDRRLRGLRHL
jgi:probable HAF family extracellular repeat protein